MQCSVKGAYPLRVDVFKQGECDSGTKAFAGIIPPPPLEIERIQCYCVPCAAGKVCVWIVGFAFHPRRGKGEETGTISTP